MYSCIVGDERWDCVQDRGWSTKRGERGEEGEERERRERERRGRGEGEERERRRRGEGEERERRRRGRGEETVRKEKETSLLFNCSSVIPLSTYSHHPLLSDDRGI